MNRELDECCRRSPKIGETNMSYKKPKKIKKIPNPKCEDGIRIDNELNMEYMEQEMKKIKDKYYELIMAVGNKYDGETRHQTALRYIKTAESSSDEQEKEIS